MTFRLLACDGGGIRGYMSSLIIEALNSQSGGKLLSHANGFAGTSTGGLISVGLADARSQGHDMAKAIASIVSIYCNQADTIFTENNDSTFSLIEEEVLKLLGISGGPGIFAAQYKATGLCSVADGLVGDRLLSSIDPGLVLAVNSAALEVPSNPPISGTRGWEPVTFTNQPVETGPGAQMQDIALRDVALATSAAPSYFPPHHVTASNGALDYGYFADGGTFANNPVMNGIEVALASGKASGLGDVSAISIGTGDSPMGVTEQNIGNPLDWGLFSWIGVDSRAPYAALLELTLTTSAQNQTRIAARILGDKIVRLDPKLTTSVALDGHTKADYKVMYDAVKPWIDYDASTDGSNPDFNVWRAALKLVDGW